MANGSTKYLSQLNSYITMDFNNSNMAKIDLDSSNNFHIVALWLSNPNQIENVELISNSMWWPSINKICLS